jgi:hypothetical protein
MRTARHSILGAGKTSDWAGATPPLGAFSSPKASWVAPSLHTGRVARFVRVYRQKGP